MRYVIRTTVGFGVMVAAIVAISYAVYQLLGVGTCASGGPYVPARECPPGTERLILVIPIAVFAMLFGAFLYATRGRAPGSDREPVGSALAVIWTGLFLGIAFACFWAVWGPDADPGPGGKTGGLIVGFLFVPMGLAGLVPLYWSARESRSSGSSPLITDMARTGNASYSDLAAQIDRQQAQAAQQAASGVPVAGAISVGSTGVSGGDDVVGQLERLDKLRRDGAIDAGEYERLKARILSR